MSRIPLLRRAHPIILAGGGAPGAPRTYVLIGVEDVMADESRKPKTMGEADYRKGALDRIGDAYILLQADAFGGSAYLAGRGAEGALRAVLWKADMRFSRGKNRSTQVTTFAGC